MRWYEKSVLFTAIGLTICGSVTGAEAASHRSRLLICDGTPHQIALGGAPLTATLNLWKNSEVSIAAKATSPSSDGKYASGHLTLQGISGGSDSPFVPYNGRYVAIVSGTQGTLTTIPLKLEVNVGQTDPAGIVIDMRAVCIGHIVRSN